MKYYKDSDVIKALKMANLNKVSGKEYKERYLVVPEYTITKDKVYSAEEINNLSEEKRNVILKDGIALHENFIFSLMNYQHLIDGNSDLETDKREMLRVLLKSEMHFVPFSFGDWNDGLHVIEKLELVNLLLDGRWQDQYCTSYLDEDIYFIALRFDEYRNKKEFLSEYIEKNDEDYDTFRKLEIYIPYSDFVAIYKSIMSGIKNDFWRDGLKKEDYEEKKTVKDRILFLIKKIFKIKCQEDRISEDNNGNDVGIRQDEHNSLEFTQDYINEVLATETSTSPEEIDIVKIILSLRSFIEGKNIGYNLFAELSRDLKSIDEVRYADLISMFNAVKKKYDEEYYQEEYDEDDCPDRALSIVWSILNNKNEGIIPIEWTMKGIFGHQTEKFEAYKTDSETWELLQLYIEDSKGNSEGHEYVCALDPEISEIIYPYCDCPGEISSSETVRGNYINSNCDTYGTSYGVKAQGLYAFYITDLEKFAIVYEEYWEC
ncbi:hypothetical protein [uncultured Clostridium sp.]|uniref:hypothetical protein n=1 Tax=uncultured Clostridium sp. TaxID=59620 RepID=UPI0028EF0E91|nr:hypothetical protein [uncultured Clostridium sp.]